MSTAPDPKWKTLVFWVATVIGSALLGSVTTKWVDSWGKGQELSFSIKGPVAMLLPPSLSCAASNVFFYQFHIENSGNDAIRPSEVEWPLERRTKQAEAIRRLKTGALWFAVGLAIGVSIKWILGGSRWVGNRFKPAAN